MKRELTVSAALSSRFAALSSTETVSTVTVAHSTACEKPESFRYTPPHSGLATRSPPLKQAKTSRGHSIYRGIILWHESLLELRVSYLLQTWKNVREIHSQYPRVTYIDADGKTCKHTFDYYVVYEDGRRLAIAVKMNRKRAAMLDMLARIEAGGITHKRGPRLADETRLMTEKDGNVASFHNCSEILAARETYSDASVEELREIVRRMTGRFRFMTLLSGCRNVAVRRSAIWRLIDLGDLVPESIGRIDELTWLTNGMADSMPSETTRPATTQKGERTCPTAIPFRPAPTPIPSYLWGVPTAIAKARGTTSRSSLTA
ncbi:Tn7 transposase TnsA N-terminal domain-containing protein [Agrobacterium larrymoorei]